MERSKSVISIVVGLAAVLIVWRVGFYSQVPKQTEEPAETVASGEPNKPGEAEKPGDTKEPMVTFDVKEPDKGSDAEKPAKVVAVGEAKKPDEPKKPGEPNEPMESVNLKSVEMKSIIQKLADWTGKVIIPTDESMKQKVTIYAPAKLRRSEALSMIYAALRVKGYIAEFDDKAIYLKPIAEAKLGEVPTIASDYPLAMIENKDQVVQKFFKLKNYSPSQMGQIILPLIGEYGYVSADENTGSLLVIDTVKGLMRMGLIIEQYDVVEAEEVETEIFEIHQGDPSEIVALLEKLLSSGASSRSIRGPSRGPSPRPGPPSSSSSKKSSSSKDKSGTATTVSVGTSRTPAVLIAEPKYNWIIAKATPEDMKRITEWIDKLDKSVPTVLVDYALSRIENKNQVVQKFFRLENYGSSQMVEIVGPLVSESGHISADPSTRTVMVIDTVQNLMRIEGIIEQFDVPEAEQTVTNTFELYHGDPAEIVQLLRTLLSFDGTGGRSSGRSSSSYDRNRYGGSSYGRSSSYYGRSSSYGGSSRSSYGRSTGSSPVIGTGQVPIVLIPEQNRKWIIARASAEDMKQIGEWIVKLDQKEQIEKEYETVQLRYADPSEVAMRLNEAIQQMPGTELQASVLIQALTQARQIMIFGREDLRVMVKKLIAEVDIPSGLFETRVFPLKYADADRIKEHLEGLYEQEAGYSYSYSYSFSGSSRRSRDVETSETVKIISFPTMQQVTVIASAENMLKIALQIEEWDIPLDLDQVKPRILTLNNSDPVQMAGLLTTLFSEETGGSGSRNDFFSRYYGVEDEKQKIVGPLYGQLTFEEVPGTKKIIVISNIVGAYDVVEALVTELDSQEMAEIPELIELKYADPEDLSERLNALFVEAGQQAQIRLTSEGLSAESEMDDETDTSSSSSSEAQQASYTPPWSGSGARSGIDEEMPISNVIGRVRFVPEPHTKSIMVLAPPEFMPKIRELIEQLDQPGKQVVIEAVIVEIEHSRVTSLGVELATNPAAFGSLSANALTALGNLTHLGTHGSVSGLISPGSENPLGATGSGTVLGVGTDIYALIDFLIKTTDAKILNQQTVWTKDNEEAHFFKGSEVAFSGGTTVGNNIGVTQDISYEMVGMELKARPSITPENNVDMVVGVEISALLTDIVNGQPVRSQMNTETNMIVQTNQTLLLGGILFQKDSTVEHKLPLLGDLPLIGGLFRHNSVVQSNSEMLVFMTPRVIDEPTQEIPEATEPVEKLENIREQLNSTVPSLE
jgi:general secretion pathway protein D